MKIRSFEPADEAGVVWLWRRCNLVRPWNDPRRDIARKGQIQPELFLVGLVDETIVGSVMAGYGGHRGWINYLAVLPRSSGGASASRWWPKPRGASTPWAVRK